MDTPTERPELEARVEAKQADVDSEFSDIVDRNDLEGL